MARKNTPTPPNPEYLAHFPDISGNRVNGLGEAEPRRPSCFFWHPPDRQTHGDLQRFVVQNFEIARQGHPHWDVNVDRGPKPIPANPERTPGDAAYWTETVKRFALENEGDLVGIVRMDPLWVFEGYQVEEPWIVLIGVAHDHEKLSKAPSTKEDLTAYGEVRNQYNRGARAVAKLRNFILGHGYAASEHPGPMAAAVSMVPAALAAGFGELGKHGSIINRTFGSNFRLAAVTTDLPLLPDKPDIFGADDFCTHCRVCSDACPPDAISETKQLVRGETKWYVNFDKCIPYFGEFMSCGICIAVCPWSRPGVADNLVRKMARRRADAAQ